MFSCFIVPLRRTALCRYGARPGQWTQKAQAAAKLEEKRRREQEEFEYAQYERAVYNLTQHANLQEQESAKEDQYAVRAHQAKQIVEKHARDAFIKEERSGKITDDFFKAFGASHR